LLVFGNQTRLLMDGAQAFPAMFQAMDSASDHINLEYFIFEDVQVDGFRLSDLLIRKLKSGIAVNIIYDAYGSQATPGELFDELRRAGAKVLTYHPISPITLLQANDRDHRKIMIVDGRIGFTWRNQSLAYVREPGFRPYSARRGHASCLLARHCG
jgi:cardiolipin synthase